MSGTGEGAVSGLGRSFVITHTQFPHPACVARRSLSLSLSLIRVCYCCNIRFADTNPLTHTKRKGPLPSKHCKHTCPDKAPLSATTTSCDEEEPRDARAARALFCRGCIARFSAPAAPRRSMNVRSALSRGIRDLHSFVFCSPLRPLPLRVRLQRLAAISVLFPIHFRLRVC